MERKMGIVQKGDEFPVRRFSEGRVHESVWRVGDMMGRDIATSVITASPTYIVRVKLVSGSYVNAFGEVEDLKPGDEASFCANSVAHLIRTERERKAFMKIKQNKS
jgi:hypothetical protein